jgi:serine protease Do
MTLASPTRRLAVALGLALVLATASFGASPSGLSGVFKRVKESVVVVRIVQSKGTPAPKASDGFDGLGSGVLIDASGKVLTAAHVVEDAQSILVEFADGDQIPARLAASAGGADVALLQLDRPPKKPMPARLGNSDVVEVGDPVFVVGAPLGMSYTLSAGYVSGIRDDDSKVHGLETPQYLQTDAAINPGNSGGPMFTVDGEVVGIVSYIMSRSGGHEGMGFAISINTARKLVLQEKSVWTGLEGYILRDDLAEVFNLPQPMGLLVEQVAPNSPAATLGLRAGHIEAELDGDPFRLGGDVILALDGIALSDANIPKLQEHLKKLRPGQLYEVAVLRAGKVIALSSIAPK